MNYDIMLKRELIIQNRQLKLELQKLKQNSSIILGSEQLHYKMCLDIYLRRLHRRKDVTEVDVISVDNRIPVREFQIWLCRQIKDLYL